MAVLGGKRRPAGVQPTPEQQLEACATALRAPLTDWDMVYMRVRLSALGGDFPRERFVRTPIGILNKVLVLVDNDYQRKLNELSYTTAQLNQLLLSVAHGFSGSKGRRPQTKPQDFLPFPDWKPLNKESATGPDSTTKALLFSLHKNHRIPVHVFTALISSPAVDS